MREESKGKTWPNSTNFPTPWIYILSNLQLVRLSGQASNTFSRPQIISRKIFKDFRPKILVSRPTGITTLPFPTFNPYSYQASLPQPSSERKKAYQKAFPRPLCLAYQAKLPNKQVRLCRSLPKIRVLFKPLHSAPLLHLCPLRCRWASQWGTTEGVKGAMTGPTLETAEGAGAGERQHVLILKGRFQSFFQIQIQVSISWQA